MRLTLKSELEHHHDDSHVKLKIILMTQSEYRYQISIEKETLLNYIFWTSAYHKKYYNQTRQELIKHLFHFYRSGLVLKSRSQASSQLFSNECLNIPKTYFRLSIINKQYEKEDMEWKTKKPSEILNHRKKWNKNIFISFNWMRRKYSQNW